MNKQRNSCWIEISLPALLHNIAQYQSWLPKNTTIAGVVKANAYGHGIKEIATIYDTHPAITYICVVNLSEAVTLRQSNIKKPILVLGYCDKALENIITHNIEVALYDIHLAQELNDLAEKHKTTIKVHIKIDTGLSRLGILPHQVNTFLEAIKKLTYLHVVTLFSHFAEGQTPRIAQQQETIFYQFKNYNLPMHTANSHGSLSTKHQHYTFARVGIGLYGYLPEHSVDLQKKLKPVLSLKTSIIQIKKISKNDFVGYDQTFQAPHDMTLAIVPFGYYEGSDLRLSNKGQAIIKGKIVNMVGMISMNLTILDITNIKDCKVGDIVTILGQDDNAQLSVYDWAAHANASVYELITKLNSKLSRSIIKK